VPVRVKDFKDVLGLQFTLNFNAAALQFRGVENNRLAMQFATNRSEEGQLSFIWNDANNVLAAIPDDEVLMELVFAANNVTEEEITITSDIAAAELWDGNFKKHAIVKGAGKITKSKSMLIYFTSESISVTPNPSNGPVQVKLALLKDKKITISLLNQHGKVLQVQTIMATKGANTVSMNLQENNALASGVYYIKAGGIEGGSVKKIVLVK